LPPWSACCSARAAPDPSTAHRRMEAGPALWPSRQTCPARMRDGTVLRADVYRPETSDPVPVILMRTQYGKTGAQTQPSRYGSPDWFASHCYLVVVQDIRGQGTSEGTFSEFAHDQDDGYDSLEWAAALPGSDGKVGMYGSSYVGATEWLAAVTTPPHLVTIVPANTASDYYDGWTYEGGEFRLAFVIPWAMGSIATTAAMNRHDAATVAELKAAAADPTRWLSFRPYKDLPPLQPGNSAVARGISSGSVIRCVMITGNGGASGITTPRSGCRCLTGRAGMTRFWPAALRTSPGWSRVAARRMRAPTSGW
jgi:uncharacterized protein